MTHATQKRFLVFVMCLFPLIGCVSTSQGNAKFRKIEHSYSTAEPQFQREIQGLLGGAMMPGNKVETLINGDQIFPCMLEAIRGAKESINFETFIYWSGTIGKEMADALSERARNGVEVRVILDWFGSYEMNNDLIKEMRGAGVSVIKYRPIRWYEVSRLNNRTHRKLLIVDGRIGFTGGVGIADEWSGNAQDQQHWRDNHYRIVGPAVIMLQGTFAEHWLKTAGEVMDDKKYFPALADSGPMYAKVQKSSPAEGIWTMELLYRLAITAATHDIRIETAYFMPDQLIQTALIDAAGRGVRIKIIVPGPHIDKRFVREASREGWSPLLKAGIEFYEYQPTMFHCKMLVVDDSWVTVGSANFDNRSFHLSDEADLNVSDAQFAQNQTDIFNADLEKSKRITLNELHKQHWYLKLVGNFYAMFRLEM